MSYKVDLHTHSYGSYDGGLTLENYRNMIESSGLDYIAITDHGTVDHAKNIQKKLGKFGKNIIVGEEIKTTDGEIIGLYLQESIKNGMTLPRTVAAIRAQGGLVYIPHPFETVRSGISENGLSQIIKQVDIIETCNGRAVFQNRGVDAERWADTYGLARAASSDSHGWYGWGRTYSIVTAQPEEHSLVGLLAAATYLKKTVGIVGLLYPKINRVRKTVLK